MSRYRPSKLHFACFTCRKSFSREHDWNASAVICPQCGGTAYMMGRWFKPPPRSAIKQWRGLEKLSLNGYRLNHAALNDADKFVNEQERRKLEHDPERRFLMHLEERPRQNRKPTHWKPPKKRKTSQ